MSPTLGPCPPADDLERLLAEQLGSPDRETVELHVELCTTCQERLKRLSDEQVQPVPARASTATPDPEPRADFLRRLREMPATLNEGRFEDLPASLRNGHIGQYEILDRLGKGGMGAVYKARHIELGKIVAIKVLTASRLDEVRIGRFKNEVRAIGRLNHPNIVAAHDAGEVGGVHYLVMDFVDGDDLGRIVQRHGRLSVPDACEAICQAANGLQHAFESGLVHRDIKPPNLMLTRTGRVQVLDLGLARCVRDSSATTLTADGIVLGTADYLAPEQWEHAHGTDIRADIYSLGCTLYQLLAGHPPFTGRGYESLPQKMRGHVSSPHTPITNLRPDVSAELATIIDRMLAKSPARRFATPAEVAAALEPFAVGADLVRLMGSSDSVILAASTDTAEAPNTVAEVKTPRETRNGFRRIAIPIAIAALLAVFAIAAFKFWPKREQQSSPASPVAIDDMRVQHYRGKQAKDLGDIRTSEEIRHTDYVRLFAKFSKPAYCYLIAFNPDGSEQLCHPAFDGNDPDKARAIAPSPITDLRFFPDDKSYFSLDYSGLQVFVLVASSQPLPPYAEWRATIGNVPWRAVRHGGEARWQFDGRDFDRLAKERGGRAELDPVPTPLRKLSEFFKSLGEIDTVRVIAFPVTETDRASQLKARELELAREGRFEEAKEPVRELIALYAKEKGNDHWTTLDEKRELAAVERVAALTQPERDEYRRALIQIDESVTLQRRGRYPEAMALAKSALDVISRALGADHLVAGQVAVHYGNLLRQSAKLSDAETVLRDALKVIERAVENDHPSTASACTGLSLVLAEQGKNSDEVRRLLDRALEISRRIRGNDSVDVAVLLNNLAGHYDRQADYAEAEKHYRESLDILVRLEGDESRTAVTTRHNLASTLSKQGKYAASVKLNREVLQVRRRILPDGHPDIAMTCNNLAYNLDLQGDHTEAETLYREVLDIYTRRFGPDSLYTAMANNGLAMNLQSRAKYDLAQPLLENSLRIFTAAGYGESVGAATAHNNLSSNLRGQRRFDKAREHGEKALAILSGIYGETHPDVAQCYNNLAAILDDEKKYAEAGALLRKAHALFESRLGKDHPQTVLALANVAVNLHNRDKYAEAEAGLRESLEAHRRLFGEGSVSTAWMYKNLVTNCWARGDYRGAGELGKAASDSFEIARLRISFKGLDRVRRSDEMTPLRHLAAVAARNGRPLDAWNYLERSLARGLLDDVSTRPLTDDERDREQKLIGDIDKLDSQIGELLADKSKSVQSRKAADKLRLERDQVQARFAELQAELARKYGVAAGKVYDLATIQKSLPPDGAFVAWLDIAGDDAFKDPDGEHWACVVRQHGDPFWVKLRGSEQDGSWRDPDELITATYRGLLPVRTEASRKDWRQTADRLYAQRLKPIEDTLSARDGMPAIKHLIVLLSTRMASIPVETLTDRFIVSYAPSATMFTWLHERPSANDSKRPLSLLALGDPDFAPADEKGPIARLPATRTEVQSIARLFSRTELILGAEANAQNLDRMAAGRELLKFRYLHFATHGQLDDRLPLASTLLLAQAGRLTAEHVLRTWKLDADLVTLSACETGRGKYSVGEGYLGFSQALFIAGARSMALSLWPVDDRATTLVMTRFYENIIGTPEGSVKPLPKAEALAEAKRWLAGLTANEVEQLTVDLPRGLPSGTRGSHRKSDSPPPKDSPRPFAHPSYWSAFILIGDPR